MRKSFKLGSAFIGIIIGAGFASGQEILQYYTSFGIWGTVGAAIATVLYVYIGMALIQIGSRMRTVSHRDAIFKISGRIIGAISDYVIIFTLFGVGVVMVAGAGSNLNQQFGLPYWVGIVLMILLVFIAGMTNLNRFITIIACITPILIVIVIIICIYSVVTMDQSIAALNSIAIDQPTTLPNWFISSINHVSFNVAVGASMGLIMGGAEPDERTAARGGFIGGLGVGLIILLGHLAIFAQIDAVQGFELPLLELANQMSPILGFTMAITSFLMIFSTAASMFFSFSTRFFEVGSIKFKTLLTVSLLLAFFLSFVGFTELISYFYPLIGYLGLFLIGALIIASIRMRRDKNYLK